MEPNDICARLHEKYGARESDDHLSVADAAVAAAFVARAVEIVATELTTQIILSWQFQLLIKQVLTNAGDDIQAAEVAIRETLAAAGHEVPNAATGFALTVLQSTVSSQLKSEVDDAAAQRS